MKVKCTKKAAAEKVVVKAEEKVAKRPYHRKAPVVETKEVEFTVHADKDKNVFLAGEFNNWDPTAKKMSYKARKGIYTATVKLPAGKYQYKFVIDGTWCADPENVNSVQNDQGTFNSVIEVK